MFSSRAINRIKKHWSIVGKLEYERAFETRIIDRYQKPSNWSHSEKRAVCDVLFLLRTPRHSLKHFVLPMLAGVTGKSNTDKLVIKKKY